MKEQDKNQFKTKKIDPRELAFEMLLSILRDGNYSHIVVRKSFHDHPELDQKQKAFIKRLVDGCLEDKIRLEYVINQFSKLPVSKMKPVIRVILYMGVYQILYMDAVPDSAACNEAVKLAAKRKFQSLKGFVNGILRNISRKKETIHFPDKKEDLLIYLSIQYSMPKWIITRWLKVYDEGTVENICRAMKEEHPITIRMDEDLTKKDQVDLLERIKEKGVLITKHPYLDYAYYLKNTNGILNVPGFLEGQFTVQDVSSMLVSEVANPGADDFVLDVCAAPGGKAMHMASKIKGSGHVLARDISERKKALIDESIERMGIDNIRTEVFDATIEDPDMLGKVDILLADLPCSGLGIIGKKRDIKYRMKEQDLFSLPKLQKQILTRVSAYVKDQGVLIYSTCTINQEENEKMVVWIEKNLGFKRETLKSFLCKDLQGEKADSGMLQLLPGVHSTDGFFIARLRKV